MKYIFLFFAILFFLSCNESQKNSNSPKTETVDIPQPLPPEPVIFADADLVGIWTVTMEITETTCEDNKAGDIKTERWIIEKSGGQILVRVKDNTSTNNEYNGSFENNVLKLHGKAYVLFSEVDVNVKAEMVNKNTISGSREIIINKPCKIVYNITAQKN